MSTQPVSRIPRPPVVTVMGHIDHGKSTLLDYIRKTKVAEREAGGITQHISAYEVEHPDEHGTVRRITFLDTPGHEAFQHLRSRGSTVADLAILVVAADDGVKPQTLEALRAIQEASTPYIVAISKIDKNNADVERAKLSLLEHGIYLEGLGGDIPFVPISSKTGEGVSTLLDLLLLAADMEELTGDPLAPASGLVIESHRDPQKGISASLVVKDGSLRVGQYVVAGNTCAPLRTLIDFKGAQLTGATFSSPIVVTGWNAIPPVGAPFTTVDEKLDARALADSAPAAMMTAAVEASGELEDGCFRLPVIIKTDVVGSLDAIKHELRKHEDERTQILVVREGVGAVTEADIKHAVGSRNTLVIGFNVGMDAAADELAQRSSTEVLQVRVIYDLTDALTEAIKARRPKVRSEHVLGRAKILKCFSTAKKMQTVGMRVTDGVVEKGVRIKVFRGETELGRGSVETLQSGKATVSRVESGNECGAQLCIDIETTLTYDDALVAFIVQDQ